MFRNLILGRLERQLDGTYLVSEKVGFGTLYALSETDAQRYADRELRWLAPFVAFAFAIVLADVLNDISSASYALIGGAAYVPFYVVVRIVWLRKNFSERRLLSRGSVSLAASVSRRPLAATVALLVISVFFVGLIAYAMLLVFSRGEMPPFIFFPFLLLFSGFAWMSIAALIFRFRKGPKQDTR